MLEIFILCSAKYFKRTERTVSPAASTIATATIKFWQNTHGIWQCLLQISPDYFSQLKGQCSLLASAVTSSRLVSLRWKPSDPASQNSAPISNTPCRHHPELSWDRLSIRAELSQMILSFLNYIYLFYFWLHWVFDVSRAFCSRLEYGLLLAAVRGLLLLWSMGSWALGLQ